MLKIIKQDKTKEDFDINKITKVAQAAGLSSAEAKKLTQKIERWVFENFNNEIFADLLQSRVFEELEHYNINAANLFKWYEDMKHKK
jgi:transcriptional regulator NrdR family protein